MSVELQACGAPSVVPGRLVFVGRGDFLKTLRARVDEHFGDRPRVGDPRLYRKAAAIAAWFIGSYTLMLVVDSAPLQLLLCISCGLAASALGFNVFHDANHGTFSPIARLNSVLSLATSTALGPSRFLWIQKHHVYHHVFTNVCGWDDDLETRGHLRMSRRQAWEPKFSNQHRFVGALYALSTIEWFFVKDFVQYFSGRMTHQPIAQMSRADKAEFWLCKALYVALFVALPFAFVPVTRVIIGFVLFHMVLGMALTLIFQLAHETEKVEFPVPVGLGRPAIDDEWARHEMRTTVNFAIDNRALTWFAGGLNFQIEHHLFPQISHTYYPELSAIVRCTAAEYGLPYHLHHTYRDALHSHYRLLRDLSLP